jgi:hypothetical protein
MSTPTTEPTGPVITKPIRHTFTPEERAEKFESLLNARDQQRAAESEFEDVKQQHKAKITGCEAQVEQLAATLRLGFELRPTRVRVAYRAKERKKEFLAETGGEVLLTEEMTAEDFQTELRLAESLFGDRRTVMLFPSVNGDYGVLIVGRKDDKWYAALSINVAQQSLEERLDEQQKHFSERAAAVRVTAERAQKWLGQVLGKESAKGFSDSIYAAIEAEKEKAE